MARYGRAQDLDALAAGHAGPTIAGSVMLAQTRSRGAATTKLSSIFMSVRATLLAWGNRRVTGGEPMRELPRRRDGPLPRLAGHDHARVHEPAVEDHVVVEVTVQSRIGTS